MIGRSWLTANRRVDIEEQPEFVVDFAHQCIDAGADIFAGHGPHVFMGVEIYHGKPIFHSLGNLIFQNDTLRHIPANPYERFGIDPYGTPSDFFDLRSGNDTKGHAATPESLQTAVAVCEFGNRALRQIKLYPVDLGFGRPRSQRGRPILADADTGKKIIERIARLSKSFDTRIQPSEGFGIVQV
jgi:poly-gamma-glutamate synthesis protein (capsule biosynthesis protein)